jgi:hypothetical protein
VVSGIAAPAKAALFVYDLHLLIDYLPGKPVDGHVHPVMLLAFDDEIWEDQQDLDCRLGLGHIARFARLRR